MSHRCHGSTITHEHGGSTLDALKTPDADAATTLRSLLPEDDGLGDAGHELGAGRLTPSWGKDAELVALRIGEHDPGG